MVRSRQLAAIMFTDIVGYTTLMGRDAAKALDLVHTSRKIQKPLVEKHQGEWLKEMGDGALAKFGTALDAVNCAIDIQKAARAEFDGKLRIGIHLGDITVENNDVYGDGVNVAARLESITDPGGIYISESIEKSIQGQTNIQAKYLGEVKLKNVAYNVRTYAVQGVGLPIPDIKEEKELSGHFWAELQRRGVVRAVISYLLVSLLLVLVWTQVIDWGISLPQWSFTALIVLLGIGLPVSLFLAWNFERSPQGFVRTTSEASWQNPLKGSQKKPLTSNLLIALIVIISLVIFFSSRHQFDITQKNSLETSELQTSDISVAVLPLKNMTPDQESRAFSDGQWEAILSQLSKLENLRVISRQSTEQYRESDKSATAIAEELRVTHLLEGSVQKYADQVRVTVQLIDAQDDRHLWAEEFTSNIENIFTLHSQIARNVAAQLELTLKTGEEFSHDFPTISPEIYDIYLSGVHLINQFHQSRETESNFNEQALNQLGIVVQRESSFADAYVQLARAFLNRRYYGYGETFSDTAASLIEKALQLDPDNFDAHKYLGIFQLYYYQAESEAGVAHLERALQINANDSEVLAALGEYYLEQAQFDKAVPLFRKSFQNNPNLQGDGFISRIEYLDIIGISYRSMGLYDEAMQVEEKIMAMNPNHSPFRKAFLLSLMGKHKEALPYYLKEYHNDTTSLNRTAQLAEAYSWAKDWQMSERYFRKAFKMWQTEPYIHENLFVLFRFGYTLSELGKKDEAHEMFELHRKMVNELIEEGARFPGLKYDLACNYAYTGQSEEAIRLLKDIPFWWVVYGLTRMDPMLDPIREHPEFEDILQMQHREMMELREVLEMDQFQKDLEWVLYR